jgi:hypothetical protein
MLIGIRNRTHLLAAQSLRIVKIQQNWFIDPPGGFLGPGQIVQPAYLYGHGLSPFGKPGVPSPKGNSTPEIYPKHSHPEVKGKAGNRKRET